MQNALEETWRWPNQTPKWSL